MSQKEPSPLTHSGTLPHGAPGSARPTGCMRICRTGCFGSVLLRGTPGSAFPTGRVRIRRRWKQAVPVCCGAVGDAGPYTSRYSLFLLSASPSTIPTAVFFFSRLLPRRRHQPLFSFPSVSFPARATRCYRFVPSASPHLYMKRPYRSILLWYGRSICLSSGRVCGLSRGLFQVLRLPCTDGRGR